MGEYEINHTKKWTGTRQRDDLKTCPFCGTQAVQQVRIDDPDVQYRIGCKNPFCSVELNTAPYAVLFDAEYMWQQRRAETPFRA